MVEHKGLREKSFENSVKKRWPYDMSLHVVLGLLHPARPLLPAHHRGTQSDQHFERLSTWHHVLCGCTPELIPSLHLVWPEVRACGTGLRQRAGGHSSHCHYDLLLLHHVVRWPPRGDERVSISQCSGDHNYPRKAKTER
eukprot:scaffold985_cov573-Prasinococcus_capsulatus_cf.AAC.2